VISASFVTNKHALLAAALLTSRQIELDGNLIRCMLNRFAYRIDYQIDSNWLFPSLLKTEWHFMIAGKLAFSSFQLQLARFVQILH